MASLIIKKIHDTEPHWHTHQGGLLDAASCDFSARWKIKESINLLGFSRVWQQRKQERISAPRKREKYRRPVAIKFNQKNKSLSFIFSLIRE
jgi:hypothetical protein